MAYTRQSMRPAFKHLCLFPLVDRSKFDPSFLRHGRVARDRSWRQRNDPVDRKRRRTGTDTNTNPFSLTEGDSASYSNRTTASDTRISPET